MPQLPDQHCRGAAGCGALMEHWHIAAVLLDMDGTLLDTEKVYLESLVAALAQLGYTEGVEELCHSMIGIPGPECDLMLRDHYGAEFPGERVNELFVANCSRILSSGLPLKRGAIALLDAIDAAGLPKAIVTSSSRRTAQRHLAAAGIGERFDAILTRDDVTRGKPSPDLYLLAAERLGVRPADCLAIEDSNPGIAAAHAAGAITLMVPDILQPTEATRAKCAAVLPDLDVVVQLLRARRTLP